MTSGQAVSRRGQPAPPYLALGVVVVFAAATTSVLLLAHLDVFRGSATSATVRGSGVAATQPRRLAPFRSVELAGTNNVTIRVGGRQTVLVHADRNLLRRITTAVRGSSLVIGNTPGSFMTKSPMSVEISMPSLSSVTLSGSGFVSLTDVKTSNLRISLPGSGVLRATGRATRLTTSLGGSGIVELGQLVARDVHATVRGSGRIVVAATDSLDASVQGNGAITFNGDPPHLTTSVTGNGAILRGTPWPGRLGAGACRRRRPLQGGCRHRGLPRPPRSRVHRPPLTPLAAEVGRVHPHVVENEADARTPAERRDVIRKDVGQRRPARLIARDPQQLSHPVGHRTGSAESGERVGPLEQNLAIGERIMGRLS